MSNLPPLPTTLPAGAGASSPGYGLSSDAAAAHFDLAGLAGLGTGQVSGADLLRAFAAAGSGRGDPSIVAAIQQALYLAGGFYTTTYTPTPGSVRPEDLTAFATALNQLAAVNKASPAGGGAPSMSLGQFLMQATQAGVEGGPAAGTGRASAAKVKVVTTPNPADVAAEYEKVAANLEGKKPSQAETQAFVHQYLQNYTNDALGKNAQVLAGAMQHHQPVDPTKLPLAGPPSSELAGNMNPAVAQGEVPPALAGNMNPMVNQGGQVAGGPADPYADPNAQQQPPDFASSMASLSDILQQNGYGQGGTTTVTAESPENVDTAAENFARNANPTAVRQNDLGNTMNMFLNLITQKMV